MISNSNSFFISFFAFILEIFLLIAIFSVCCWLIFSLKKLEGNWLVKRYSLIISLISNFSMLYFLLILIICCSYSSSQNCSYLASKSATFLRVGITLSINSFINSDLYFNTWSVESNFSFFISLICFSFLLILFKSIFLIILKYNEH